MARPDLSTIGVKFGWAVETTSGVRPTAFTQVLNCKSIGGIPLTQDNIDTTPLESSIRRYVAGLKDTGGSWELTFGMNDDLIDNWGDLLDAYKTARDAGLATWAVVWIPGMENSCYITFQPGEVPLSEIAVSSALEVSISNTINEYKGFDTAIEPTI